jgi:hypothetical protein
MCTRAQYSVAISGVYTEYVSEPVTSNARVK